MNDQAWLPDVVAEQVNDLRQLGSKGEFFYSYLRFMVLARLLSRS